MRQDTEISISGKLTLEDFIKYNHYHMNKVLKLYVAISFMVIFLILRIPMSGSLLLVVIFAGAPALLLSGLLYLFSKQLKKRQSIEQYKSDQLIKQMVHYTFDADGMTQLIKSSNNQYEWDDFFKARENKAMFLLYLSKNKAMILPKRFFDSQKQIDTFKHLITENIESAEINIE